MGTRKQTPNKSQSRRPPATSLEAKEQQMIGLAVDLVEEQLRDGTASSQVITHYLKLGTTRERLEQERLRGENELLQARIMQLESQRANESLYREALDAFRSYSGNPEPEDTFDD